MTTEIRVPTNAAGARLSMGRWFKRIGDPVTFDEHVVEINTDKQTYEIRAPVTGVLSTILLKDGAFVEVGVVLGTIRQF
jgi:2-oxoglutarate dehydrogenase E2 component (dihydrolipoamide succinyltransferase)